MEPRTGSFLPVVYDDLGTAQGRREYARDMYFAGAEAPDFSALPDPVPENPEEDPHRTVFQNFRITWSSLVDFYRPSDLCIHSHNRTTSPPGVPTFVRVRGLPDQQDPRVQKRKRKKVSGENKWCDLSSWFGGGTSGASGRSSRR